MNYGNLIGRSLEGHGRDFRYFQTGFDCLAVNGQTEVSLVSLVLFYWFTEIPITGWVLLNWDPTTVFRSTKDHLKYSSEPSCQQRLQIRHCTTKERAGAKARLCGEIYNQIGFYLRINPLQAICISLLYQNHRSVYRRLCQIHCPWLRGLEIVRARSSASCS